MTYTIIPSKAVVDNSTIELNQAGELQIKGGAVNTELISDSAIIASKLSLKSDDKLVFTRIIPYSTLGTTGINGLINNSDITFNYYNGTYTIWGDHTLNVSHNNAVNIKCGVNWCVPNNTLNATINLIKNGSIVQTISIVNSTKRSLSYDYFNNISCINGDILKITVKCEISGSGNFRTNNRGVYGTLALPSDINEIN